MQFATFIFWTIFLPLTYCSDVVHFRIRHCSYEFFTPNRINQTVIRVPITYLQKYKDLEKKNLYICKILMNYLPKVNFNDLNVPYKSFFSCLYQGSDAPKEEELTESILSLYTDNLRKDATENVLYRIVERIQSNHGNLDFNFMMLDLMLDVLKFHQIQALLARPHMFKWLLRLTTNILRDFYPLHMYYVTNPKNLMIGAWASERSTMTFEVLTDKIFLNFIKIRPTAEYSYIFFKVSSELVYLTVVNKEMLLVQNYIVLIKKEFKDAGVSCNVRFNANSNTRPCNVSDILPNWAICQCNILGMVIIKFERNHIRMKHELHKVGGLTPSFIDLMNVKKLEDKYRYGRMGDLLLLTSIVISLVNIAFISILVVYYRKTWKNFSPTKRQILSLFVMLWLHVLLVQPAIITYFLRDSVRTRSSEYIAWGFLSLHSITTYTMMLGGAQFVIFVCTVNSYMWSLRFFDFILGFVGMISCTITLIFMFIWYHRDVVSINRLLLLPDSYCLVYLVLVPLIFITLFSFILSGMSCYLPKRGGGIAMMTSIYPLLFLHMFSYIMILLMKESRFSYNYLQYMLYTAGIFLQTIYLFMWLIVLFVLPMKNLTIFGKRDCNFRLEYIYLIDLHCPKPPVCAQKEC